ncbi:MAG: MFS transporter [Acidobacteriota bacterium]|nr:MFS transporter [Acidobacteriota bacterium]
MSNTNAHGLVESPAQHSPLVKSENVNHNGATDSTTEPKDTLAIIAVTLAAIAAFLNVFATQPLLPLFEQIFHASKAEVGRSVSVTTLGVALSATFWGTLAERVGRRKVIVISTFLLAIPTVLTATSTTLTQVVIWRFLQGLIVPGIFGVTIAYITEEWPRSRVPRVMSIYLTGVVFGGFLGRLLPGVAAVHQVIPFVAPRWGNGFIIIGTVEFIFGFLLWRWLRRDSPLAAGAVKNTNIFRHLRNPQLIATCAVGFNVFFSLVAAFSYVTFYLAAPPFNLSPAKLGMLFMIYLVGLVVTPLGGIWISRAGSRTALICSVGAGIVGILLTLIPNLPVILLGLTICSSGVFICQTASNSYIQRIEKSGGRASATGLYVMVYYAGGGVAGVLPGYLWRYGQWKACVALIVFVQVLSVIIAGSIWKGKDA